jgi:hypothetical protein
MSKIKMPETSILPEGFAKYTQECLKGKPEAAINQSTAAFMCGAALVVGMVADLLKKRKFDDLITLVTNLYSEIEYLADALDALSKKEVINERR